jgi:hypothetical protein
MTPERWQRRALLKRRWLWGKTGKGLLAPIMGP